MIAPAGSPHDERFCPVLVQRVDEDISSSVAVEVAGGPHIRANINQYAAVPGSNGVATRSEPQHGESAGQTTRAIDEPRPTRAIFLAA
jgi:hypothetical protein